MNNLALTTILERRFYDECGSWCRAEEKLRDIVRELENKKLNVEEELLKLK